MDDDDVSELISRDAAVAVAADFNAFETNGQRCDNLMPMDMETGEVACALGDDDCPCLTQQLVADDIADKLRALPTQPIGQSNLFEQHAYTDLHAQTNIKGKTGDQSFPHPGTDRLRPSYAEQQAGDIGQAMDRRQLQGFAITLIFGLVIGALLLLFISI